MSDRSQARITCSMLDADLLAQEVLGCDNAASVSEPPMIRNLLGKRVIEMSEEEVPYGGLHEAESFKDKYPDVPFILSWESAGSGTYPAGSNAYSRSDVGSCSLDDTGAPIVSVDDFGEPNVEELHQVRCYLKIVCEALEEMVQRLPAEPV